VRHRGPHLLPGHSPAVAVLDRPRAERGQVRAGARLTEQLAPHLLAGPERAQVALALLVGAAAQDRGRGHAQPDTNPFRLVRRGAGRGELGVDDLLQRSGRLLTAQPDREVHPGQPGVVPGPEEVQPGHRFRWVLVKECVHELYELIRLDGLMFAHRSPWWLVGGT
jgi:hypothetical protein